MRRNQISSFGRNRPVYLNRRGASVQSTAGSRGVRISGSNAGYTMFRGSVKWYWLPTAIRQFPLHFPFRAITFQLKSKHFVGIWCLRPSFSETSVTVYQSSLRHLRSSFAFRNIRSRIATCRFVTSCCLVEIAQIAARLQGVTSQKIVVLVVTDVRTSDVTRARKVTCLC